jgi:hypothetical protein
MLAQSFMSAADLGISDQQRDALQKTLVLLETGKLEHIPTALSLPDEEQEVVPPEFGGTFNMRWWSFAHNCGTAGCIGGTAEMISGVGFGMWGAHPGLSKLFWPVSIFEKEEDLDSITTSQAAHALRSYLTTGDAKWAEAVA